MAASDVDRPSEGVIDPVGRAMFGEKRWEEMNRPAKPPLYEQVCRGLGFVLGLIALWALVALLVAGAVAAWRAVL